MNEEIEIQEETHEELCIRFKEEYKATTGDNQERISKLADDFLEECELAKNGSTDWRLWNLISSVYQCAHYAGCLEQIKVSTNEY